jgi:hypothetical protein
MQNQFLNAMSALVVTVFLLHSVPSSWVTSIQAPRLATSSCQDGHGQVGCGAPCVRPVDDMGSWFTSQ